MVVRMPPAFNTLDMGRVLLEPGGCCLEELATAQVHLTLILQPLRALLPNHHLAALLLPLGHLPMQPHHFSIIQEAQRLQLTHQHHPLLTSLLQVIPLQSPRDDHHVIMFASHAFLQQCSPSSQTSHHNLFNCICTIVSPWFSVTMLIQCIVLGYEQVSGF